MTTTTILMLCLVAFLIIAFYQLFFSQTDEIPTDKNFKPLPSHDQTTQISKPNPDTNLVDEIAPQQHDIFAKDWDELAPKSI